MTRPPEPHSIVGRYTGYTGRTQVYRHVEVEPCADVIASCNACGRSNYVYGTGGPGIDPEAVDLPLVDLSVNPNGFQRSITKLCAECALDAIVQLHCGFDGLLAPRPVPVEREEGR